MKTKISIFYRISFWLIVFIVTSKNSLAQHISRKTVFERHLVVNQSIDTLNALSVGNGTFAMTLDATGLQTFPTIYQKGIPLGTLSDWGWHSFVKPTDSLLEQTFVYHRVDGRQIPYAIQPKDPTKKEAADKVRQNPHRIHLAQLGWVLKGQKKSIDHSQMAAIKQVLNPWNGVVNSSFNLNGILVEVETLALQNEDGLLVKVKSPLVASGQLGVQLRFPFPTNTFLDEANHFENSTTEQLVIQRTNQKHIVVKRTLNQTKYFTQLQSNASLEEPQNTAFGYTLFPQAKSTIWTFKLLLSPHKPLGQSSFIYEVEKKQAIAKFTHFWEQGAIIDFSQTADPRAFELERRMVLSRYLRKVNCSGPNPPQETGLTYNSWYGKPHIEMFWWHALPFSLWGNTSILEQQMGWFFRAYEQAQKIAKRQGYQGIRWQKMTDNEGGETVSSVGSYLIWQQAHLLFFAEQLYLNNPDQTVLQKYAPLVEATADFMSSYLRLDLEKNIYHLGPFLIPSQESYPAANTFNPIFELAYWRWGLESAQRWRQRLGQQRVELWDQQIKKLAPYPGNKKMYWAVATTQNPFKDSEQLRDHPSVLGAFSIVPPQEGFTYAKIKNTLQAVEKKWRWDTAWGWDFPMAAMVANRIQDPDLAIAFLLKNEIKNTYLKNGHNYQTPRLRLYLPGNGGLLIALAQMATAPQAKGFPAHWKVLSEGFPKNLYHP